MPGEIPIRVPSARSNSRHFAEKTNLSSCWPLSSGSRLNKVFHVGKLVSKVHALVYRNANGEVLVLGFQERLNRKKGSGLVDCVLCPPLAPFGWISSIAGAGNLAQCLIRPISGVGIQPRDLRQRSSKQVQQSAAVASSTRPDCASAEPALSRTSIEGSLRKISISAGMVASVPSSDIPYSPKSCFLVRVMRILNQGAKRLLRFDTAISDRP